MKQRPIPTSLEPYLEGKVLLFDKPLEWTSFDVIRKVRGLIRIKKVGHAGTLDPLATGLLIVCTGKFTKKINEYMGMEKEYTYLRSRVGTGGSERYCTSHTGNDPCGHTAVYR
jgi:tRNA pseudouridine55 synthase